MSVIKRNGTRVPFNREKIINAIKKAGYVRESTINKIVNDIQERLKLENELTVEQIQDLVEIGLMNSAYKKVAIEYIRYRKSRELIRQTEATNESILRLIDDKNEYLKTENSNKNHKIASTQRDYIAGEVSKDITIRLLLPERVSEAHKRGAIHFHDSDYFIQHIFNCFAGETKFITDKGLIAFNKCNDGDQVNVLTKDGKWSTATVRMYGQRQIQRVTLRNGMLVKDVRCTPDHRWILEDGTVTTNLSVGDRLFVIDNEQCKDVLKTHYGIQWTVDTITKEEDVVDCWCVEEPTTHSFTLAGGVVTGNCCLVNLEDILQNGTVINGTMIEKPHSFTTACNIATQVAAIVASNQYGGQTMSLAHLAPFVDISRQQLREIVPEEYVEPMLKREIAKGVQMIQYQINTLNSSNGQTPFITIWAYLNEAKSEQEKADLAMIIEEVFKQRIKGVKNEMGVWISPSFPKIIYAIEEDNCKEGTKYWWLTELAAKCTAKRLVPDYISEKKMKELKGYCYPSMG